MKKLANRPELSARDRAYVADLRKLADFLESRPECIPYCGFEASHWPTSKEGVSKVVRRMGRAEKRISPGGSMMYIEREFGEHKISVNVSRDVVCKKVLVRTETVTKQVAATFVEVNEEVPVYEWECKPVLGSDPEALPQEAVSA